MYVNYNIKCRRLPTQGPQIDGEVDDHLSSSESVYEYPTSGVSAKIEEIS